ncbi:MAG: hypothetical protein OXF50_24510 [Caldilineaceae bacterium]|nr:hypothetical protein [Caldilineaceae bacterium]
MAEQLIALWQEAEEHLQAFQQYARRTVEEAWLAGDALMRIKEQLPHGGWRSGLEERGITKSTAHRFISLRKKYPEMSQVGTFSSVSAALTAKSRYSKLETQRENTEPQDQPPAQPTLLENAQEELQEPPQPQERPQAAQALEQPSAQPEAIDKPLELQEQLLAQPEAIDEPPAEGQEKLQVLAPSGKRLQGRTLQPLGKHTPPFQRRPPNFRKSKLGTLQPTANPPVLRPAPAVRVPSSGSSEFRQFQLRLRTPRLLLPGSHTTFRLGLSCFVDVDEAAENKNAAPDQERQSNNPDARTIPGRKA